MGDEDRRSNTAQEALIAVTRTEAKVDGHMAECVHWREATSNTIREIKGVLKQQNWMFICALATLAYLSVDRIWAHLGK